MPTDRELYDFIWKCEIQQNLYFWRDCLDSLASLGFPCSLNLLNPWHDLPFSRKPCFSNVRVSRAPGGLVKIRLLGDLVEFLIQQVSGRHFWMCTSDKRPGDADAAAAAAAARPTSTALERIVSALALRSLTGLWWQSRLWLQGRTGWLSKAAPAQTGFLSLLALVSKMHVCFLGGNTHTQDQSHLSATPCHFLSPPVPPTILI